MNARPLAVGLTSRLLTYSKAVSCILVTRSTFLVIILNKAISIRLRTLRPKLEWLFRCVHSMFYRSGPMAVPAQGKARVR